MAVQDALDLVRKHLGPRRTRVVGQVAAWLGALGWLAGAMASVLVGHDVGAAALCVPGSAAFAGLGLYPTSTGRRLRQAESLLEDQLRASSGRLED